MAKRSKKKKATGGGAAPAADQEGAVASPMSAGFNRDWLPGLLLILAVILAYQPVWYAGFIWDDDRHLTENPVIVGPSGLLEIWTTSAARICPLVLTSFWFEHALWGLHPLPYHLVNVVLHGASAIVLWQALRLLRVPGAWLGAALWALHPVQVESVAWITEMKNTQSGFFYLLSILFFIKSLKAGESGGRKDVGRNYGLTLLFAALAMASKSSTVILPLILCLCAWWVEGRWQWRNLVKVGPIVLMAVVAAVVSMWTQSLEGANDQPTVRSGPERLITAGNVIWFYLGKLAWPHPLIFIYPRWQIDAGQWLSYLPLLGAIGLLVVFWLKRESWGRPCLFALGYFVAALLPVLGLVDHYFLRFSFVSDHFQYLASMGPLALAGVGMVRLADYAIPQKTWIQSSLCAALLLGLGFLSWQRGWAFQSDELLWIDTLARNPDCWMAENNLGLHFFQKGQIDEAVARYQTALKIRPNYADAHYNLGLALLQKGQVEDAIAHFQNALAIDPEYAAAYCSIGNILLQKGEVDDAIVQYQKALKIVPNYALAYANLGAALFQKNQVDEAMVCYRTALKINPSNADAHNDLGLALAGKGQWDEAIAQYQLALQTNPGFVDAHYNLGNALLEKGEVDDAMVEYRAALEINPNYARAHSNLGAALFHKGHTDEAVAQFQAALEIAPNNVDARYNLGGIFLQTGRLDEAIEEFQKALEINPKDAEAHNSLGNAFLQKKLVDKAIPQFEEALRLRPDFTEAKANLVKARGMTP